MRITITGGHLTPALAVIDELQKKHPEISLLFVGREFSRINPPQRSQEREQVEKRGVPFIAIDAAKFHRLHFWKNVQEVLKIPLSFWQVFQLMRKYPTTIVLSFGGYVSLPVCMVARCLGITIVTHEQTKTAGLSNRLIGTIADVIAVTSERSLPFFPAEKTVVTGNPIRPSLFREYKTVPTWFTAQGIQKPIIYVTGGSQGSQIINNTIAQLLPKLVRKYVIVHQCGNSKDHSYLHELESVKEKLAVEHQAHYVIREWIEEKEVSFFLRNAQFVISRAGANTVEELTLVGTPAIFIPLAFAHNDEQYKNIQPLLASKASSCVLQKDLIPDALYDAIQEMDRSYDSYKANMIKQSEEMVKNGTQRLVSLILTTHDRKKLTLNTSV